MKYLHFANKGRPAQNASTSLLSVLLPSVLGICACMICLCTLTWGWFSAQYTANIGEVSGATYSITPTVYTSDVALLGLDTIAATTLPQDEDGAYALNAYQLYDVQLETGGDAVGAACRITLTDVSSGAEEIYYAQSSEESNIIAFWLCTKTDVKATFTPCWITEDMVFIEQGSVIGGGVDGLILPDDPAAVPDDPSDPADPADPTDPADPVDPTDPTDPVDPADPADPVDPADPTDPVAPADPTDPTDPETAIPEIPVMPESTRTAAAVTAVTRIPAAAAPAAAAATAAMRWQAEHKLHGMHMPIYRV